MFFRCYADDDRIRPVRVWVFSKNGTRFVAVKKTKKTWKEKLHDSRDFPRIEPIPEKARGSWGEGTVVIVKPIEVDELMKQVPEGKLTTMGIIRQHLAEKHGATITCPLTTGIFARIAAEASAEAEDIGETGVTPYWRTLKSDGALNHKYPGGIENQQTRLQSEGHRVVQSGKTFRVSEFELKLFYF